MNRRVDGCGRPTCRRRCERLHDARRLGHNRPRTHDSRPRRGRDRRAHGEPRADPDPARRRGPLRIGNGRPRWCRLGNGRHRARLRCRSRSRSWSRSGGGSGRRGRLGRRRRRRRRRRSRHDGRCGQERERVEIALGLGRDADAEVDVRPRDLGVTARADRGDRLAFCDGRPGGDRGRAEMRERDREPVGGGDRERASRARDGAAERRRACGRCKDDPAGVRADVDPAVLSGGVRMRRVEAERLEDRAVDRPRPGTRHRRDEQRGQGRNEQHTTHRHHLCCQEREQ